MNMEEVEAMLRMSPVLARHRDAFIKHVASLPVMSRMQIIEESFCASDVIFEVDVSSICLQVLANESYFQLIEELEHFQMDPENPAVLFNWRMTSLSAFVEIANREKWDQPEWLTSQPGFMSEATLTNDIVTYMAEAGNGHHLGRFVLPEVHKDYYPLIFDRINEIANHPFFQRCAEQMEPNEFLGDVSVLHERYYSGVEHIKIKPQAGLCRIFF